MSMALSMGLFGGGGGGGTFCGSGALSLLRELQILVVEKPNDRSANEYLNLCDGVGYAVLFARRTALMPSLAFLM